MKYQQSQQGFSLVETLVAITILLIVIVGPMSIASSAARSTSFASEQVIAFFLAQEGAEIAQKARDDMLLRYFLPDTDLNYLANPWGVFADAGSGALYEDCFLATGCGLELNTDATGSLKAPVDCADSATACQLKYNASAGRDRYTYDAGTDTLYTRIINFETISGYDIKITSTVYWRTGSQRKAQQVEVETYLFDVYGN